MRPKPPSEAIVSVAVFLTFIFGITALNVLTPTKETSVYERRTLAQFPAVSAESVLSGDFASGFGGYAQDQAAYRDEMRFVKSAFERNVFGKVTNNGVYPIGPRVSDQFYGIRDDYVRAAGKRMNEIIASIEPASVSLSLIPTKAQSLQDERYLRTDQHGVADPLRDAVGATYIDLFGLADAGHEARYYGADPHWTTAGAIDAYEAIARAMGLEPVTGYRLDRLTDTYVGSEYGKAASWAVPLDTIDLAHNDVIDGMSICRIETADRTICHDSVYVPKAPQSLDDYDVFLGGLAPIIEITNPAAPAGSHLVLFKDSYAHAVAPFLAQHYRTTTLVDLRYVQRQYVLDRVDFAGADVLFLYSTSVINTDSRALN